MITEQSFNSFTSYKKLSFRRDCACRRSLRRSRLFKVTVIRSRTVFYLSGSIGQTRKRDNCECVATWERLSHASPLPL